MTRGLAAVIAIALTAVVALTCIEPVHAVPAALRMRMKSAKAKAETQQQVTAALEMAADADADADADEADADDMDMETDMDMEMEMEMEMENEEKLGANQNSCLNHARHLATLNEVAFFDLIRPAVGAPTDPNGLGKQFAATDTGVAGAGSGWTAGSDARSVCAKTANWLANGLWDMGLGPMSPTTHSVSNAPGSDLPNWANTLMQNGAHPGGANSRVCKVSFSGMPANGLSHNFVIEAPTPTTLRHYQSFVRCYTAKDWLSAANAMTETLDFRVGGVNEATQSLCTPVGANRAKTRFGSGNLLTAGTADYNAYVAHMQTLIDNSGPGYAGAPGGRMAAMRTAYRRLFGVDIENANALDIQQPRIQFWCQNKAWNVCKLNRWRMDDEVITWRNLHLMPYLPNTVLAIPGPVRPGAPAGVAQIAGGGGTGLMTASYFLTTAVLARQEAGHVFAAAQGGSWAGAAGDLAVQSAHYTAWVDALADVACTGGGILVNPSQYRFVFRGDNVFYDRNAGLRRTNRAATLVPTAVNHVGAAANFVFDLHCLNTAVPDLNVPAAHRAQCDTWAVSHAGGAPRPVTRLKVGGDQNAVGVPFTAFASRWEMRLCVDGANNIGAAWWMPSATLA